MGRKNSAAPLRWHEVASNRAHDVRVRLVFSTFIALAGQVAQPQAIWPAVWLGATAAAQLFAFALLRRMHPDRNRASRPRRLVFFSSVGLSACIFAAAGPLFWFLGGWGGRLFAMIILAGAAVSVAMQAGPSARLFWVGCAPLFAMLLLLPLISFVSAEGHEQSVMGMTAFAAALFVAHLIAAGRHGVANARRLAQALRQAHHERLRAERASQAKSDFLGMMSHELRTPLNGVLGMVQAIDGDELSPAQRERLEVVRQSGEILLTLLNDVIDISRIDTASLELEQDLVDVGALAAQTESVFRPLAVAKGLRFEVRLLKSAGTVRMGDSRRVRQVLHNLVSDAVKFTDEGHVTVVLSGVGDELVFEVSDTSRGVSAERWGGLFDEFELEDGAVSESRRRSGPGLGLGVARGLARLMGGDVTARDADDRGSIFTARLTLPVAEAALVESTADWPVARMAGQRLRVLAAEDNPTNQLVLKTLLEQLGLAVHVVSDGDEAVAAWSEAPWDVVLMDIRMPGMDGFAATRAIRAREAAEGRVRTPIVAVTADAAAHQVAEYVAAGMDGLVPKPIQLAELARAVEAALAGERLKEPELACTAA